MRRLPSALGRSWMQFAHAIGRVNTVIILVLFFFVILLPFGIISRVMRLIRDSRHRDTYWIPKKAQEPSMESLRNPF